MGRLVWGPVASPPPGVILVDVYAIHAQTGVRPGTIRRWASEGRVRRYGMDERRRTLYSLDEVIGVAERLGRDVNPW